MKNRRQAVVPFALLYFVALVALSLIGPIRVAKAYLRDVLQGSGKVIRQERPVAAFHAVQVSGIGELQAVQGDKDSLTIEAEDNIAPLILCDVKDGCLYIKMKQPGDVRLTKPVKYHLSAKKLDRVGLSGATSATIDKFSGDNLSLSVAGASHAKLGEIRVKDFTAKAIGASSVTISGKTDRLNVDLTGASQYHGDRFQSKTADVSATGASAAKVQASDSLTARAVGASNITYRGGPKVSAKASGASHISGEGK